LSTRSYDVDKDAALSSVVRRLSLTEWPQLDGGLHQSELTPPDPTSPTSSWLKRRSRHTNPVSLPFRVAPIASHGQPKAPSSVSKHRRPVRTVEETIGSSNRAHHVKVVSEVPHSLTPNIPSPLLLALLCQNIIRFVGLGASYSIPLSF